MTIRDILDSTLRKPPHVLRWVYNLKSNHRLGVVSNINDWLTVNASPSSDMYELHKTSHGDLKKCSVYRWRNAVDRWQLIGNITSDGFDEHWPIMKVHVDTILPDLHDVWYISQRYGDGWTLTTVVDKVSDTDQWHYAYVAFDDVSLAIQCKLAVSC